MLSVPRYVVGDASRRRVRISALYPELKENNPRRYFYNEAINSSPRNIQEQAYWRLTVHAFSGG